MYRILLFLFVALVACNGTNTTKSKESTRSNTKSIKLPKKVNPKVKLKLVSNPTMKLGDQIRISFTSKMKTLPDSIIMVAGTKKKEVQLNKDAQIHVEISDIALGRQMVRYNFYWGDSIAQSQSVSLRILSNTVPEFYSFKVIEEFEHDVNFFTQGLEFDGEYLYEGTGQTGESLLSKIHLDKNEVLQQISLPNHVFGEGVTVLKDKVYQLTWQSQLGYVYDKETLRKLYEFSYPTEGWGLCNNGKELIMSDGSENIYFLDTEFMQKVKQIQVYDNQGMINRLNELEYKDGLIYANVYGTHNIVAFDEHTGKVVKHINLKGMLNRKDVKSPIDVLNGIAWDEMNKRWIVTGKYWPKLFHIELVPQG